jgi:hypothetical protein
MSEFNRCQCGAEWNYRLNIMDDKPMWFRPKAKRGEPCKHPTELAEVLTEDGWKPLHLAENATPDASAQVTPTGRTDSAGDTA